MQPPKAASQREARNVTPSVKGGVVAEVPEEDTIWNTIWKNTVGKNTAWKNTVKGVIIAEVPEEANSSSSTVINLQCLEDA